MTLAISLNLWLEKIATSLTSQTDFHCLQSSWIIGKIDFYFLKKVVIKTKKYLSKRQINTIEQLLLDADRVTATNTHSM